MCEFSEMERPIVIQVFGSNPENMAKAVKIIDKSFKPDGIDINMGCPVAKIASKNEAGAALMKNYDKALRIVEKIKKKNPEVTLSVKTRLGWKDKNDILEFAPKLESVGAEILTIHGRTKAQGYSGEANWDMIKKSIEKVNIPVIANRDIASKKDIKHCLEYTGASGVMIGRGALGNPFIFGDKKEEDFSFDELIKVILRHAGYFTERQNTEWLTAFRKQLLWYFKSNRPAGVGFDNIKEIRRSLSQVETIEELESILSKCLT